jgi:Bacteriocin-protection, YdeI or OmpD-Associated
MGIGDVSSKTFKTTIVREGSMSFIPLTFDPKRVFGKIRALKAAPQAWERWRDPSYSHQREYVETIEEAKKPDTRTRRIDGAVRLIRVRPKRKR